MHATKRTRFENYVNYAGSKTNANDKNDVIPFENYVNYAGSKTVDPLLGGVLRLRTM